MATYPNFYETINEVKIRLVSTVITYDNDPYYVIGVAPHDDGIFRLYIEPVATIMFIFNNGLPDSICQYEVGTIPYGKAFDAYLDKTKKSPILRKKMNSPSFNKFRPFSLGMMNINGNAVFTERTPQRHTQQGLIQDQVVMSTITMDERKNKQNYGYKIHSDEFARTIRGDYPTAKECVDKLASKTVMNSSVAFCRDFAFLSGPVGLIFVAHQRDVIGYLPGKSLDYLCISQEHWHLQEKVKELGVFADIVNT